MRIHLKKYFLLYAIVSLLILLTASSYYRFMVLEDYIVIYEWDCDPEVSSCYIGCEDEECSEIYYYKYIEREATKVKVLCGEDITDCEEASYCPTDEAMCSVYYCNEELDAEECSGSQLDLSLSEFSMYNL